MLVGIIFEAHSSILGNCAFLVGKSHPGDHLPFFVRGDIFNLVGQVHMPVDATRLTLHRVASANLQNQTDRERSIGFVGEKMAIRSVEVANELLWPVALLASFLGWAKIL